MWYLVWSWISIQLCRNNYGQGICNLLTQDYKPGLLLRSRSVPEAYRIAE